MGKIDVSFPTFIPRLTSEKKIAAKPQSHISPNSRGPISLLEGYKNIVMLFLAQERKRQKSKDLVGNFTFAKER